ncbi:PIR protein [Plasmodium vivax]|nr:PIR protein [Plasmodium vivax]
MAEILGQPELDKLNTIIYYNYFDNYTESCANYPLITAIKSELVDNSWKNDVSDKILNALCYVYGRKMNNRLDKNTCNYFYYWLGSKVLTNLRHKHFFFEVVHKIYGILNGSELGKICDPAEPNIYNHNFQKFKDIYDLSENYYTYKSHFIKSNPSCYKNYQDELKSYLLLYKQLRNECTIEKTNYHEEYCNVFNKFFTKERDIELSLWKCKLENSEEQFQQLEAYHIGDAERVLLPARREKTIRQKHYRQEHSKGEQFSEGPSALHTGLHTENTVMDSPLDDPDYSSPSTIKKSLTSAASAAGVLVPPFLIYNYAPARSWINKLLGRKQMYRNPYANQELMADFSMPEDFYSERNRYNIMYNPE